MKRTIEISTAATHVCVRQGQLVLKREGETLHQAPCEDLGSVVVDHPQATYSHAALVTLARTGCGVVLCDERHTPAAVVLPLADHSTVVWRLREQTSAGVPLKKQLWRQLVRAKVRGQARNLAVASPPQKKLLALVDEVRSGDPANVEARAARIYWRHWLGAGDQSAADGFRRDQEGSGVNALLNYGYAIVRAAIARAIVAAGLQPSLGIHHCHRANGFCLADDLIEPFRPVVDAVVRDVLRQHGESLTREAKGALLGVAARPMLCSGDRLDMTAAIQRIVFSLTECFGGRARRLAIAEPIEVEGVA